MAHGGEERWEHRTVSTNGVSLHCVVAGEGPLVILLHGFPECWYSWRHQIAALAPSFRVVAPDLRGYGESDKPAGVENYSLPILVADVHGLLAAFDSREAVIVGHDWGGALAWTFASAHPDETTRLIVLNCPHPALFPRQLTTNMRQLLRSWYMFFFQIPWLPERLLRLNDYWAIERAFRNVAVRPDAFADEDIDVYKHAAAQPGALSGAINYYRAAFRAPETRRELLRPFGWVADLLGTAPPEPDPLPLITAPTLLVWGENDLALGRELTEGLEPLFSGPFETRYIPACGHWVQQEEPDLVNHYLLEFLDPLRNSSRERAGAPPLTSSSP